MKKAYLICFFLSFYLCAVGVVFRDWLNILDKLLVFSGVALFLFAFWQHCTGKALRCTNCNAIIRSGHIRTIVKQKEEIVQCENCGSLVRVHYPREL